MAWKSNFVPAKVHDGDNYLDLATKNIIELPKIMLQQESSFDIAKYVRMNRILISQLENIAIGTRKIKPIGEVKSIDDLTEPQKELRKYLMDWFRKNNEDMAQGSVFKADYVMRFILEGEYPTKIEKMKDTLDRRVKEGKITQEIADAQLDNYKLQMIIRSASKSKARKVELDA